MRALHCVSLLLIGGLLVGCMGPGQHAPAAGPLPAAVSALAMPDRYSAEAVVSVFEAGGNAVDAAVAAGFVLAVTYPEAGNIGGGGFMLLRMDGEARFLDYRETAPSAAHRDMYLDEEGQVIEDSSLVGHRASGVPGTVAGLWAAHAEYGVLDWSDLLAPAIRLAESGFEVHPLLAEEYEAERRTFRGRTDFETRFGPLTAGRILIQTDLARTLRRIAEKGPDGFYRGETARLIVEEMERGGGLISQEDLLAYRPVWRQPLRARWREFEVLTAALPSSGGIALIQMLKMKDRLADLFDGVAHHSPAHVHLVAEIEKRVFADRAEYLGDPDFVESPVERLLDEDYLGTRASEVNPDAISAIDGVRPGLDHGDTTHFSIVDRWGNAVSNTYTLNTSFGSGVTVAGAGFLLNSEMDDFSVKPGVPNYYGVVGDEANAIAPGKRMLSSMTPTIVLHEGRVHGVVGTPGGSTIFTSVFQILTNLVDFGMTPEQAVGSTRFHHQLLPPDLITFSPGRPLPESTVEALQRMGYRIEPHDWDFGDLQLIWTDEHGYRAASDPRGRGQARVPQTPVGNEQDISRPHR